MATPIPDKQPLQRVQIKSRQRVRELAEVYTHKREVDAMLGLVDDMFPSELHPENTDRKFLEPACGSGNFLEEILVRKLRHVTVARYGTGARFEHRTLRALASIYAIDIDAQNVGESKDRLRAVVNSHLDMEVNTKAATMGFADAVEAILETNIIRADSLADADSIRFVDYQPSRGHTFVRQWSPMVEQPGMLGIFDIEQDAVPVHYTELALHPTPTVGGTR
ncbi:hypothetical protein MTS1_03089 [Microbacterium sp. TS-1]|uniref:hypothetical protein n=1 Tax=Microbacterium sp. TS-1 TaxID=1344956 RepID=UPI00038F8AED|nr:hypothetical protein [Microbacterium sp. TS-1]GAD35245.1 hypothetical protein MTS1_03089 [Microbacterium sp. TS-1]